MNPQAEALNKTIQEANPSVYELLSDKGLNIFFPKKGILGQTADAKGKKYNATIGAAIEDDNSPMRLSSIEKMLNIEPEKVFPYAPSFGRPDLRKQWKEMIYEKNPSMKGSEISLPVVSNALTHGLSIVGYLFGNSGDSILLSDLYWGNYNLIFSQWYNTSFETFKLFNGNGFDLDSFKSSMLDSPVGKKLVILNFPNNPTGYSPTKDEAVQITAIIKEAGEKGNKIAVICDDAYFGLVYEEGIETESIFAKLADLHENVLAIKLDGPTKEDYVWGFRVGFITYGVKGGTQALYEALAAKTAGAIRGNISNAANVSQSLLMSAFTAETYAAEKQEKFIILQARYKKVKEVVANPKYSPLFKALPFNSGYFMCLDIAEGIDGEELRQLLLSKYDTGVINMSNVIRLAFAAVAEKDIEGLFENIYNACKELS